MGRPKSSKVAWPFIPLVIPEPPKWEEMEGDMRGVFCSGVRAYIDGRKFDESPYGLGRGRISAIAHAPRSFQASWEAGYQYAEKLGVKRRP
jgi:hypothetical protein